MYFLDSRGSSEGIKCIARVERQKRKANQPSEKFVAVHTCLTVVKKCPGWVLNNVQTFSRLYFISYSSNRDFQNFLLERKTLNYAMKLANQKTDFPFLPSRVVFYA